MEWYYEYPPNRIGDEITVSAPMRYFMEKGDIVFYRDANQYISAIDLFPDNLVIFAKENLHNSKPLDLQNLWFWSVYLKSLGIYSVCKDKYESSKADIDFVFIPVLDTSYYHDRAFFPTTALNIFGTILQLSPNTIMIVDAAKRHLIQSNHPAIIASDDIHKTFALIRRSRTYIGGDTGTSHYAGAIKHPRMLLIYPDERALGNHVRSHRDLMTQTWNLPFYKFEYSSLPCCDSKQYRHLTLNDHDIGVNLVLNEIDKL